MTTILDKWRRGSSVAASQQRNRTVKRCRKTKQESKTKIRSKRPQLENKALTWQSEVVGVEVMVVEVEVEVVERKVNIHRLIIVLLRCACLEFKNTKLR